MTDLTKLLNEIEERADAATEGPGKINHHPCRTLDNVELIAESFRSSLMASIEYDGGHDYYWIETDSGLKIGEFGNGPTSEANAVFWGEARTDVPRLVEALRVAIDAYENRYVDDLSGKIQAILNGEIE